MSSNNVCGQHGVGAPEGKSIALSGVTIALFLHFINKILLAILTLRNDRLQSKISIFIITFFG